ncbi:aspartic peptidase domain-containing protein [Hypoxylon rubiginosum]|uniref:Aspartic peptidase domain-containing protein n=1 Tax=Hypoxylon rubiginosum TaxID=110542 RepID=A0ACC0CN37_9PEZI|nr:aspartic peptidase domain-containing protein [Hypoxylon rubiginosum]
MGPVGLTVPAALGNPPQPFRLLLDLSFDTLFVPSATLDLSHASPGYNIFRYYSNESSTFVPGPPGQRHTVNHGLVHFGGEVAFDDFIIANVHTKHQPFINIDEAYQTALLALWWDHDGVLGLSPRWNTSANYSSTPSPWSVMVDQGVLDHNLFALDIPRGPNHLDDPQMGELSFGGINPKYESSNFAALPIVQDNDRVWAVEAQSVTWTNKTHPIHYQFDNTTAIFTTDWVVALPDPMAKELASSLSQWVFCNVYWCWVECAAREHMPDFVFQLAGQNFTVTAFEYAPMAVSQYKEPRCSFDIWSSEAYLNPEHPVAAGSILLGTPFLNAFYSVFDLDKREIRRKCSLLSLPIHSSN